MRVTLIADTQRVKLLNAIEVLLLIIEYQDFIGPPEKYFNNGVWDKMIPLPSSERPWSSVIQ
jgi:hypothetical protein